MERIVKTPQEALGGSQHRWAEGHAFAQTEGHQTEGACGDASMSRLEGQARKVQDYELPILAEALDVSIEQLLNDEMANR